MFDDLFGELETAISGTLESETFQFIVYVIIAYIVLIWLASAYWAYRDMRLRSASAITPYVAAAAIIVFTPIFFLFGLLVYRIVRPKETIAEVNERALAEETMLAEVASHSQCANCSRPVHEDWIICPTCRNRLRRVCPNCEHLIELDWTLCAWCGKDFERAEAPGTAAFMPSARPAPRLPQGAAPHAPVPPPTQPARGVPPPSQPSAAPGQLEGTKAHTNPPSQPQGAPPSQPQGAPPPTPRTARASSPNPAQAAGAQASGGQPTTGA